MRCGASISGSASACDKEAGWPCDWVWRRRRRRRVQSGMRGSHTCFSCTKIIIRIPTTRLLIRDYAATGAVVFWAWLTEATAILCLTTRCHETLSKPWRERCARNWESRLYGALTKRPTWVAQYPARTLSTHPNNLKEEVQFWTRGKL